MSNTQGSQPPRQQSAANGRAGGSGRGSASGAEAITALEQPSQRLANRSHVRERIPGSLHENRIAEVMRAVAAGIELMGDPLERRFAGECAQQREMARAALVRAGEDRI